MRDLYIRLGINTSASLQEIRAAIQSCGDPTLKEDATEVLLSDGRRKTYDQVHAALTDIGTLRAKLGLAHGENWQGSETQDFNKGGRAQSSANKAFNKKIKRKNVKVRAKSFFRTVIEIVSPLVVVALVAGGVIYYKSANHDSAPTSASQANTPDVKAAQKSKASGSTLQNINEPLRKPTFNEPKLALPATGFVKRHTDKSAEAPLQIKTSAGANYLVRLEDLASGKNAMEVFVRGGTTVEIEVPLGTYQLKYASGKNWYGTTHLFGPETAYNKADTPFRFYIEGQRISGYTVTLYRVQDGNLRTSQLNPKDF